MALKDWWNRLRGGHAAPADQAAVSAEQRLDRQRAQYEASHQQRGRMSPTQGGGNVGF